MTNIDLTKRETAILTAAAAHDDRQIVLPSSIKEGPAGRLLAKFLDHALVIARAGEGATTHHLTPAGFRALGLKPPRAKRMARARVEIAKAPSGSASTKRDLIIGLLGREEGASLDEIIAATGWLPHTTRAALSRLRSGGQELAKSPRDDGRTAYHILGNDPEPMARVDHLPERAEAALA
jgi:hypothetical protein